MIVVTYPSPYGERSPRFKVSVAKYGKGHLPKGVPAALLSRCLLALVNVAGIS